MTVLLTGATGTVGSALADRLVADGRRVRALVRDPDRAAALLPPAVELARGDVTDPQSVTNAMVDVTSVFHVAGLPEQWQPDPTVFDRVNAEGTRTVAEAALAQGVDSFVFTSTIDVFTWPTEPGATFDESTIDPTPKHSAYERSKQAADRLVTAMIDRGLPARFVAPAGVFGPAPSVTPGLNHLIARLLRKEIPLLLPGGLPAVYSPDVADLHVRAEQAPVGARYIASDRYLTLQELATAVAAVAPGTKVPRVLPLGVARAVASAGGFTSRLTKKAPLLTPGELGFLTAEVRPDAGRAARDLGWEVTPFDQALAATVERIQHLIAR